MEAIVTILIFIAVIAITALLFGGWLVVKTVTCIGRFLLATFGAKREPPRFSRPALMLVRCGNDRCRAESPPVASFCRRCGAPMRPPQRVPVRRVAMW